MKKLILYPIMFLVAFEAQNVPEQPDSVVSLDAGENFTLDEMEVVFSLELMRHSHRPTLHEKTSASNQIPITEMGKRVAFQKG